MSKLAVVLLTLLLGFVTHAAGTASPAMAPPDPACGNDPPDPGTMTGTVTSGGIERHYRTHVPASYDPGHPGPLLIALHGRDSSGTNMERLSGLSELDTVVVYPEALTAPDGKTAWQGAPYSPKVDDVAFIKDLIDQVGTELCVDQNRIYSVGISNGGGLSAMLGCRLADRLAGYATVAGAFYPDAGPCVPTRPLPLINFHGTGDETVPYDGDSSVGQPAIQRWMADRAELNGCRSRAPTETPAVGVRRERWQGCAAETEHYRISGGGHTWPSEINTTEVIWSFLTG